MRQHSGLMIVLTSQNAQTTIRKKCKIKHRWVVPALRIFFADKNEINNRTVGHAEEFMARVAEIVRIQRKELKQRSRNQLQFVK